MTGKALPERDARDRLPNRRPAVTTAFDRDGSRYEMTVGYYPDGRVGEVFLSADRANSLLDFLMSDAAILASLDSGEGLEFFCIDMPPNEMATTELQHRAELIRQLEVAAMVERMERADSRDAWMHTGEAPPPDSIRNGPAPEPARQSNRPAQSTIDAFLYLVSLKDPDRLVAWLQERERDRPFLLTLLEAK
jgi:hypothetical protein